MPICPIMAKSMTSMVNCFGSLGWATAMDAMAKRISNTQNSAMRYLGVSARDFAWMVGDGYIPNRDKFTKSDLAQAVEIVRRYNKYTNEMRLSDYGNGKLKTSFFNREENELLYQRAKVFASSCGVRIKSYDVYYYCGDGLYRAEINGKIGKGYSPDTAIIDAIDQVTSHASTSKTK